MFCAKHHVRVNGVMYRPGEVIEEDPNAVWHLKVGAIEKIAPAAGETPSDTGDETSPNGGGERAAEDGDPREEETPPSAAQTPPLTGEAGEEAAPAEKTDCHTSAAALVRNDNLGETEPEEIDEEAEPEEIDEEAEPEEIDVMAGIVTEPAQEKPAPAKRKSSSRKREGGKSK
ncbi:MAG: hypothetical protein IJK63_09635 [Oscillospiraceae bacterium]|nr:hypothetical protein [Oscillospiraceae bacterium]